MQMQDADSAPVVCLGVIKGVSDSATAASRGGQQDERLPKCVEAAFFAAVKVAEKYFANNIPLHAPGYLGACWAWHA
jgi:hypothetical protein